MKPKQNRVMTGSFFLRSKDYYFTPEGTDRKMYGYKAGAKVVDGKLFLDHEQFSITYEIVDNATQTNTQTKEASHA